MPAAPELIPPCPRQAAVAFEGALCLATPRCLALVADHRIIVKDPFKMHRAPVFVNPSVASGFRP
jgi:hypothetical protein